jgi:hypothetical protein
MEISYGACVALGERIALNTSNMLSSTSFSLTRWKLNSLLAHTVLEITISADAEGREFSTAKNEYRREAEPICLFFCRESGMCLTEYACIPEPIVREMKQVMRKAALIWCTAGAWEFHIL